MQPSKLYVIGNGFELWHGISSSYAQFKEYVKRVHQPPIEGTNAQSQDRHRSWINLPSQPQLGTSRIYRDAGSCRTSVTAHAS
ncbi:MAG: AbiH family protein [Lautropia sp.]